MKFMLLIYHNEQRWSGISEAEKQSIYGEYRKLREQIQASKQFIDGSQLEATTTATSIRIRDGEELVTDGPFAETHEQLGGYFLIETANLDEAIAIARRIPSARTGTIEVRPLAESRRPGT